MQKGLKAERGWPVFAETCPHYLAMFDRPMPCPACGAESGRTLSVPASLGTRRRHARLDQPTTLQGGGSGYRRLRHGGDCTCCSRLVSP